MWVSWRRESFLSFHSHGFVFHLTTRLPPLPKVSSYSSLVSPLLLLPFPVSSSLFSPSAAVVMKALNIRGNPWTACVASSHLSLCARALVLWSAAQLVSLVFISYDTCSRRLLVQNLKKHHRHASFFTSLVCVEACLNETWAVWGYYRKLHHKREKVLGASRVKPVLSQVWCKGAVCPQRKKTKGFKPTCQTLHTHSLFHLLRV